MPKTAKLFWSGRTQTVRVPREFHMDGEVVRIRKQEASVVLEPVATDWAWLDAIEGKFSMDFLVEGRNQQTHQVRPALDSAFE